MPLIPCFGIGPRRVALADPSGAVAPGGWEPSSKASGPRTYHRIGARPLGRMTDGPRMWERIRYVSMIGMQLCQRAK